jgi:hypothetical protein
MLAPMGVNSCSDIRDSLRNLYLEDPRPWLVGFSGGKDSAIGEYSESPRARGLPDELLDIWQGDFTGHQEILLPAQGLRPTRV